MRRVSIRNKTFGFDGAEHEHMLTAVIVNAAPIQRAYYSEAFDADKPQTPVCWSSNTQYPDTEVHEVGKMQATVYLVGQGEPLCLYRNMLDS